MGIPSTPKLKLNAKTIGFNETNGFVRLNIFNPSAVEDSFSILWDYVDG